MTAARLASISLMGTLQGRQSAKVLGPFMHCRTWVPAGWTWWGLCSTGVGLAVRCTTRVSVHPAWLPACHQLQLPVRRKIRCAQAQPLYLVSRRLHHSGH